MKWSWKLTQVAGIGIYVHSTFLILVAWIALAAGLTGQTVAEALATLGFVVALFSCIVLHELGHALTARRYGIRTRDITLLPIGGLARLERMPERPMEELVVAIAGPAVNFAIAGVLAVGLWWSGVLTGLPGLVEGPFLERLLSVNLLIAGFNLLPAFPMDGGRMLRALLATRRDYVSATDTAAHVGQGLALVFGLVGLLFNPFLIFIALFVWIGAAAEAGMVQTKAAFSGVPIAHAMLTDFQSVSADERLGRVVERTLRGSQKDFPVVEGGRLQGILTQDRLLGALARHGPEARVADVALVEARAVDPHDMLDRVLESSGQAGSGTVPVLHRGRLVGLVTADNVQELLRIQLALRERAGPDAPGRAGRTALRGLARLREPLFVEGGAEPGAGRAAD